MNVKKIVKRTDGKFLTIEEAKALCKKLRIQVGISFVEYQSVSGYPTPALAERATMRSVLETYEGYTFAYTGTVNVPFEGYKVFVIAIHRLPQDFESRFPEYVVLG